MGDVRAGMVAVAPPAPAPPPGEAHVWLAWTERCCAPGLLERYTAMLSADERTRMAQYRFEHLRIEYLVTRALCRTTLSRYAAVAPTQWRFRANDHGRPEVIAPEEHRSLRFNLSNARGLVACIVARDIDVGIDVEETSRRVDPAIAANYFAPAEAAGLRALPEAMASERFFHLWTLKEAYIKARGLGLSLPLDAFEFDLAGPEIAIAFHPPLADRHGDWQFRLQRVSGSHVMAMAIRTRQQPSFGVQVRETVPLNDAA